MIGKHKNILLTGLMAVMVAFTATFFAVDVAYADHPAPCLAGEEEYDGTGPTGQPTKMCRTATPPGGGGAQGDGASDDGTTCAIEKVGWMLCPVIEAAGKVGDQAFQMLSKNFLETEPELVARFSGKCQNSSNSDCNSGTYMAWELARNIANLMFIAAFLIIILSQVTGRGLDNYGIKKLLPKLIIAALAVNLSYYICQLMVDLTNVMGYEIQNFLVQAAAQVSHSVALPVNTTWTSTQTSSGTLGQIAGAALAVAGVIWFLLPVLFLGVSTVVITCFVIIAILLMRKAFIVLLVVLSPIAFVLYLLPNTEKYFQKWMSMFWQLLLVFPTVSLLFGGGQLASAIVLVAGTSSKVDTTVINENGTTSTKKISQYGDDGGKCVELPKVNDKGALVKGNATIENCNSAGTSVPFTLGLVAAGIAVAPLIAVWAVLKGALSAAGAIGGKIAGAIQTAGAGANKYARKPEDALRKGAFQAYKARALSGKRVGIGGRTTRFMQRRKMAGEARENALKAAEAGFGVWDESAKEISEKNISAQQQANAAHLAEMQEYAKSGKAGSDNYLGTAGNKGSVQSALAAQAKRASEETVKAYSEGLSTTDVVDKITADGIEVKGLGTQFKEAINSANPDHSLIKALVDELMKNEKGRTAVRSGMSGIAAGTELDTMVRQRIQTTSPGAKNNDGALKNWVDGGDGGNWSQQYNSEGAWINKVDTAEKFAALDKGSQAQMIDLLKKSPTGQAHLGNIKNLLSASPNSRSTLSTDSTNHFFGS